MNVQIGDIVMMENIAANFILKNVIQKEKQNAKTLTGAVTAIIIAAKSSVCQMGMWNVLTLMGAVTSNIIVAKSSVCQLEQKSAQVDGIVSRATIVPGCDQETAYQLDMWNARTEDGVKIPDISALNFMINASNLVIKIAKISMAIALPAFIVAKNCVCQ